MINIRSVSDLRNYTDALKDIGPDSPVFLTKNGRGKYVVMLIEDYEKLISAKKETSPAASIQPSVPTAEAPAPTPAANEAPVATPAENNLSSLSVDDVLSALGVE
mgnify:CR=1 FL=1